MPTSASESNKDGKSGLGSGGSGFFFLGTLGLIRAWRGETDGESLLSRRFTARFAQTISQERLVRRGARIGGYVFETKKKVWIALHESWRLHTLAKQRGP
jgi:hypothetical protein